MRTPVLLVGWIRADTIRQVLHQIAVANPPKLYVSLDGPRPDTNDDISCSEVHSEVLAYPGDGELVISRKTENSKARGAILGAMDWFFRHEPEGIILEDDSLPHPDFFKFAEEHLEKHRDNENVFQIAGTHYIKRQIYSTSDFFLSRHMHIWGFATWQRSWEKLHRVLSLSPEARLALFDELPSVSKRMREIWKKRVESEFSGEDDNWDSTWNLTAKAAGALSVTSTRVLVENIGFDDRALHSRSLPLISGAPPKSQPRLPETTPVPLPADIASKFDAYTERVQWHGTNLLFLSTLAGLEWLRRRISAFFCECNATSRPGYRTVAEIYWEKRLLRHSVVFAQKLRPYSESPLGPPRSRPFLSRVMRFPGR